MKKSLKIINFKINFNISEPCDEKSNILREIPNEYYIWGLKRVKTGSNAH